MDSPPCLPPSRRVSAPGDSSPVGGRTSGTKRPASLLPAFEPLSSSPGLPRPLKRQNTGTTSFLPTPVPTSSTGMLASSSPPRCRQPQQHQHQQQQQSSPPTAAVSERAPLSAVPSVELPDNGESISLGRSSNSSQVQLSSNRLVSRVHVVARYLAGGKMEIKCTGWNGLKLHCQGRTWELLKGDTFTSETEGAEVMVDVLDARVMIQWPRQHGLDDSWDDSPPPSRVSSQQHQASPLRRATRITSPESPTPARRISMSSQRLQESMLGQGIDIYEDDPTASMRTEATADEPASDAEDEDPDEENDPIVHSFGPFGADIAGRMAMIMSKSPKLKVTRRKSCLASASSSTEDVASSGTVVDDTMVEAAVEKTMKDASVDTKPLDLVDEKTPDAVIDDKTSDHVKTKPSNLVNAIDEKTSQEAIKSIDPSIINHIINQLAFSRLSSTPLSTIMHNLPSECLAMGAPALRTAMEATPSIGIIPRQGKDAAGKPLESEYYYVADKDDDQQRRAAVVDGLRKPSLRACRKQHKVGGLAIRLRRKC
ncbi:hypothetical protein CDD80_3069 [Ophiocordyceps camponoti-rufipedis]|uniref:FHA domain-containing protein n=1 Tax=Ophiocordyceps camponoti-rufipedis TaxID=2004952 RepID=A0A2C5Z3T8_9HYPO|nr:hypothetical protein CDD80_3069 [Ophiocordyceps camponoti-rufipedis]